MLFTRLLCGVSIPLAVVALLGAEMQIYAGVAEGVWGLGMLGCGCREEALGAATPQWGQKDEGGCCTSRRGAVLIPGECCRASLATVIAVHGGNVMPVPQLTQRLAQRAAMLGSTSTAALPHRIMLVYSGWLIALSTDTSSCWDRVWCLQGSC